MSKLPLLGFDIKIRIMKTLLLILFFSPLFCTAQKLLLIDRNFYHPVVMADSISLGQALKGLVPVYFKDLRAVSQGMQWLIKQMTNAGIEMEESFTLKMGNSNCIITTEKNRRVDKYSIVLNTEMNNLKTSIVLASGETKKRAMQRVAIFMDYLRNNSSLLIE